MSELVKGKDVIGLNVVTIDTGTIVETVKDIGYNPNTHRIEALFVSKKKLFKAAKAIHMDDVIHIGKDAVVVHDVSVIKSVKEQTAEVQSISNSNKYLVKTNVLTSEGNDLGKVTDIYFDSVNGIVENMEVSQGGFKTLTEGKKSIKPSDIVTIGADTTIVSAYAELLLEQQGEHNGLKGNMNDARERANEIAAAAQSTTNDLNKKAQRRTKEITENIKERATEFSEGVSDANNKISDQIDTNYTRGRKAIQRSAKKLKDKKEIVEIETTKVITKTK